jgi:hypothetical protein
VTTLRRAAANRAIRVGVGFVIAALVTILLGTSFRSLPDSLGALAHAEPGWLAAAAVTEALSYLLLGLLIQRLSGPGRRVSLRMGAGAGLVAFGLGNVLPGSPAPGFALAGMELRRRGLPTRAVAMTMALSGWFLAGAFLAITASVALTATAQGRIPERHESLLLAGSSLVLALLVASVWLTVHPWPLERLALLLARFRWRNERYAAERGRVAGQHWHSDARQALGGPLNGQLVMAVAFGSWMADAACLRLVLAAVGADVDFDVLLMAYLFAVAVSCLPFLPGGIGAVEVAVPAVLHHYGVPLDQAIAGTVAWRAMALLAPAAGGAVTLAGLRLRATQGVRPEALAAATE